MRYATYKYDDSLAPGDIITSYGKGYFRVTRIEKRYYTEKDVTSFDFLEKKFGRRPNIGDEMNPLVHSIKLLTQDLVARKGKEQCDACFCRRVPPDLLGKIQAALAGKEA